MVYEDEEPDLLDPNYDESAQVSLAERIFVEFRQVFFCPTEFLFAALSSDF